MVNYQPAHCWRSIVNSVQISCNMSATKQWRLIACFTNKHLKKSIIRSWSLALPSSCETQEDINFSMGVVNQSFLRHSLFHGYSCWKSEFSKLHAILILTPDFLKIDPQFLNKWVTLNPQTFGSRENTSQEVLGNTYKVCI